jgi:hypothetical protein
MIHAAVLLPVYVACKTQLQGTVCKQLTDAGQMMAFQAESRIEITCLVG